MDYDDNDFQSQNLHLAGEGSTKFPPALRPYALPKFDFDESHLRFDSLVETEVFLGIESNEDNQWIDAFSRGSSGIEFSSTAAESCSISRHNNVWSEATSTESVEMLLKSVGQEEFITRQTVVQESDACDELACLAKQMDPDSKPNDKNEFNDNVTDLQPPGDIHDNLSGLKEDVEAELPQAGVSQGHEGELSIDGNSSNLHQHDICRNIELPVPEGEILFTEGKSNYTNQRKVEALADGSHHDKTPDDPSASVVKTNITVASKENIPSTCDVLNIQNVKNQVAGLSDEQQGPYNQDLESYVINKEYDVDTQTSGGNAVGGENPHCSIPIEAALESSCTVEGLDTGVSSLEDSLGMVTDGVSDLLKAERCSEDICFRDLSQGSRSEDAISLKDPVMDDQSALYSCDSPKIAVKDDSNVEGKVVEVSNSNCVTCPSLQENTDTVEKKTCDESRDSKEKKLLDTGHRTSAEILLIKSEPSMFIMADNNISTGSEEKNDSGVVGFSGFSVAASSKSCILGESTQVCEISEPDRQVDSENFRQDSSVVDQEINKVHSDSIHLHCDADQSHLVDRVGSSSPRVGSMETELVTSAVSVAVMPVNNSALQIISENISLTSCEIIDVPPPPSKVVSHDVTEDDDYDRVIPVRSSIDGKEDSAAKIADEAGLSTPVGSSEQEIAPCPVSETEKHNFSDTSGQQLCETASNSLQNVGTTAIEKIGEPQEKQGDKVIKKCTKEIVVDQILCESTEKQGEVTVSFTKDDKVTAQENHGRSSTTISGDILLANEGSISSAPLPNSCVDMHESGGCPACPADNTCSPSVTFGSLPQTKKGGNQVKASANLNPPVSEIINRDETNMLSTAHNPMGNDASKDGRSLTSEVNPAANLSKTDSADLTTKGKDVSKRQHVLVTAANKPSIVVEGSPSASVQGPTKTQIGGNISHGSLQISDGEVARRVSKGTPERKPRRASNKTAGKESSRKRSHLKGTAQARQSERGDKSTNVSLSPSPGFWQMQSKEAQQYGYIDSSSTKPFALLNASTSSLPDLNASASPPVLFQQPFTDLQQVQLRAQIFVYGALIQGTVPDEAYMISCFGGPDGGKSIWESAWRSCMERQRGQNSHPVNPETPLQSRSGPRASESAVKLSSLQGKGLSSPLGRTSSKATPTIANPAIPLSSPLWSVPTPCGSLQSSGLARGSIVDYPQAITSLHPYQTPPPRNFIGHNTSWISHAPLHGPWITSRTSVPDNSSHLSASPTLDTNKLSTVKGSSLPPSSSVKNIPPGLPASSAGLQNIFVGTAPLNTNNVTVFPAQPSSDPKPKKRKKVAMSEEVGQKALQSESQLELTPAVNSHTSTNVAAASSPVNVPITTVAKSVVSVSPLSLVDQCKSDWNIEKRILSDESLAKVKEARVSAEEASAFSAAAVNHSLEIWKQLDKQKNSGLVSDIEAKLASAAVAAAAAAAVAKAAAAAADVASNAAFQAKLMADEALVLTGYDTSCQSNAISLSKGMNNLGRATPASILKGANGTDSSNSIIAAAKEAVRRRVEGASAASKRAENMDAIVKAAELAAEAASKAGKIVAMGDPLPLSYLVEAGPDGCWKDVQDSSQQVGLLKDMTTGLMNIDNVGDIPETSHTHNRDILSDGMGKQVSSSEKSRFHEIHNERSQEPMRSTDGISTSIDVNEKNSKGPKGCQVSDRVNPVGAHPESDSRIQASFTAGDRSENLEENNMKEGSLVEVFKDEEGFKAAWFTANILSLKDGKAYVCYTVLVADEGLGPLKEWVSLEGEGDKPPRIRTARPLTCLHYEGTRKRRRATMLDYTWSVGDRVDAWMQESWQEGVVTENKKKDETTLTVHFPASGETSVVRAWHLRPSLIWKDGKWIESSQMGVNDSSTREGDMPQEKRPKLGSPAVEVKGKDNVSKSIDAVESANPGELRLLDLTENDKVFNIGKKSKNENKSEMQSVVRTGLQKEGPRVIFGVPKPGKKRKFMEVSKHYVAEGTSKINDANDSVKLADFLMPQGSRPRGWKNSYKSDTREKHGAVSKPKTFKFGKLQSVSGRVIPPKENPPSDAFSHTNDLTGHTERTKDSSSHLKNGAHSEHQVEGASYSGTARAAGAPILYSSRASSTDSHSTKKASTLRASRGKLTPAGGKLGKVEVEKPSNGNPVKPTSDVIEPRRSNRRIQPTSRLLEGLQSSLIISKLPSGSHDKGHKNLNRNASSRGNNQG